MLDALTRPVHRNGGPAYLTPGTDFYQGDTRDRDLVTPYSPRRCRLPLADHQDYLPDFSRFSDVNVVSTALLYEIIVAERLDLARVVVASSQSAMGEDSTGARSTASNAGIGPSAPAAGQWDIPCPVCGGPMERRSRRSVSPIRRTPTAYPSSARRWSPSPGGPYGIPTVALRTSSSRARQSVYNAYWGACRIFS